MELPETLLRFDAADFSPAIRTRLLILQPTPFCNINCDYCYLPDRNSTARMSIATIRRAAERLRDDSLAGNNLTVVWHAGEPLSMPPAFLLRVLDLSGFVARNLSGCHIALGGRYETDTSATGDTEDEIRRSL